MLVFRNGNDNMAYGNSFIDSGGIRVKEASNIFVFSNYFENSGIGGKASSVAFDYIPGNLKNINFLFNTFVNCAPIDLGGNGPSLNRWSNNLFKNKSGAIFQNPNAGTKWLGNKYQGVTGLPKTVGLLASKVRSLAVTGFISPIMYPGLTPTNPLSRDLKRTLRPQKISLWDVGAIQTLKVPAKSTAVTAITTGPRYLQTAGQ
jgi:hypothetical protein